MAWQQGASVRRPFEAWTFSVGIREAAARLRTMRLMNESLREGKGAVVIPSAFAEGFNEGVGDLFKG